MVLASDVLDRRGRLLIPAGKALSERHVSALRMWGVERLEIRGEHDSPEDTLPLDPQLLSQARAEVADLFRNAGDEHPFLEKLTALAVQRRARTLARPPQEVA